MSSYTNEPIDANKSEKPLKSLLDCALHYLRQGLSVLPARGNEKRPIIPWKEFQSRLPTEDEVCKWFAQYPTAGMGILTGATSGVLVLDVDPRNGGVESLNAMLTSGELSESDLKGPQVRTQSGGSHSWFAYPKGFGPFPNVQGIRPGIDLKGDGGFVMAPPSTVPGTNRRWEWGMELDGELPDAPETLLTLWTANVRSTGSGLSENELAELMQPQAEGKRTDALVRLVGHFVAKGESKSMIMSIAKTWNAQNEPPIEDRELEQQVSGMLKRWSLPKQAPPLEEIVATIKALPEEERFEALVTALEGISLNNAQQVIWRRRLKTEFKLTYGDFDALTRAPKGDIESEEDTQAPVQISEAARTAAQGLLHEPALLYHVLLAMRQNGLVGEGENALVTYLAATSRLLNKPIDINVIGPSASGKSEIMLAALRLIPREHKLVRQRFTPQAIIYMPESIEHKVVAILEREGMEGAAYNFRTIQSEQMVEIETTVRDPNTGKMTTKSTRKKGPAAFVTSTTNPNLDEQDASRTWVLHPDDSEEQTWRIAERQNLEDTLDEEADELFCNMQRELVKVPVAKPTHLLNCLQQMMREKIGDPPLRFRRDWPRTITAIQASALLHQFQRERDGNGRIVPDIRDYVICYRLCSGAFQASLRSDLDPKMQVLLDCLYQAYEELKYEPVSTTQLLRFTPWSSERTVRHYIQQARNAGLIEESAWQRYRYVPITSREQLGDVPDPNLLPTPDEIMVKYPELRPRAEFYDPVTGKRLVWRN